MYFRTKRRLLCPPFRLVSVVVTLAVSSVWFPTAAGGQTPSSDDRPAGEAADQSDAELEAVRGRLAKANAQTAAVLNDLKSLDARTIIVTQQLIDNEEEIAGLQSRIRSAEDQIAQTEVRVVQVKKTSNARAARVYKDGPSNVLATLFTLRTFADIPRLTTFWKNLSESDGKVIVESMRLKNEQAAQKADLAATSDALSGRTADLTALRGKLVQTRQQRTASLGKLKTAIQEAMAAERAVLAARAEAAAAAARAAAQQAQAPKPCSPGSAAQDAKLASLLNWYAPAAGPEPFIPPKLSSTDVTFNGVASWYGPGFEGCRASSGATFRSNQMTAASLSLPFGALIKVTSGGKAAVVVITDRGPYIPGRDIDLSKAAAQAIGMGGVGPVTMEILLPSQPAPPYP